MAVKGTSAKSSKEDSSPSLLPLPELVLKHHGEMIFKAMKQWRESDRVPPVLLITGPSGIGKRAVVHFISQWLLCKNSGFSSAVEESESDGGVDLFGNPVSVAPSPPPEGDPLPCGECSSCQRALKNQWVDFTEIAPEVNEESSANRTLKIEQFRTMKASLGFSAFDSAFKIILISEADHMTVPAANSLLKILEEPPRGWIFFLTASDPSLLLPTLVSRCQRLQLKPFSSGELQALLAQSGASPECQLVCSKIAQGSWRKAISLAGDEIWDRRSKIFQFIQNPVGELNGMVDWASQTPENLELLIDQLEQLCLELIRHSTGPSLDLAQDWVNQDGKNTLVQHANSIIKRLGGTGAARAFWTRNAERMARARIEMWAPLNKKILAQDILIPWLTP